MISVIASEPLTKRFKDDLRTKESLKDHVTLQITIEANFSIYHEFIMKLMKKANPIRHKIL